jgi:ketosteroid isomerase-like protein
MSEESTTPNLTQVWRRSFDALNAGDIDAAMSRWGHDPVLDLSPMGLGVYEGFAAIRGFWEGWTNTYQELSVEPEEMLEIGRGLTLAAITQTGRPARSSSDVRLHYAAVAIWTDTEEALEAVGLAE